LKKSIAILFSLLLIVAQTVVVAAPVSSSASAMKRTCCGEDCRCCVGQSSAPVRLPIETSLPVAAQSQFIFIRSAVVILTLAVPVAAQACVSTRAVLHRAELPIFQRNCAFLI
jgi:hypothetical protein